MFHCSDLHLLLRAPADQLGCIMPQETQNVRLDTYICSPPKNSVHNVLVIITQKRCMTMQGDLNSCALGCINSVSSQQLPGGCEALLLAHHP